MSVPWQAGDQDQEALVSHLTAQCLCLEDQDSLLRVLPVSARSKAMLQGLGP